MLKIRSENVRIYSKKNNKETKDNKNKQKNKR